MGPPSGGLPRPAEAGPTTDAPSAAGPPAGVNEGARPAGGERCAAPIGGDHPSASGPRAEGPSRHGRWVRLAIVAIFAAALVAFFAADGPQYFTLDAVKANRDALRGFARDHYAAALAIAFLVYVGATSFSLPGAVVLSLATGFLFGRWVGTALVVVAATVGATIVFLAARYLFADAARARLGVLGRRLAAGFDENAFHYLLFLRLVPAFPFFLVNLVPAVTAIRVPTFVLATFVGIIPGTFVFVNLGQTLGQIDSLAGLVAPGTLGALALLGLFALLPVLVKRWRAVRVR